MSDTINDSGSVFTLQEQTIPSFSGQPVLISPSGMTLRDYFAASALQGLLSVEKGPYYYHWRDTYAEVAYDYADMMLMRRAEQ